MMTLVISPLWCHDGGGSSSFNGNSTVVGLEVMEMRLMVGNGVLVNYFLAFKDS